MSGVDHIHTLTRQYSYRRIPSGLVLRFTCRVKVCFSQYWDWTGVTCFGVWET